MRSDLREACDRNLVGAFAAVVPHVGVGGEVREFGGVVAIFSGVESAFFNPAFALSPRTMVGDVEAAVRWIRSRGREPSVQVADDLNTQLAGGIRSLGLVADPWPTPGMVLDPIPAFVPVPPAGLRIEVLREAFLGGPVSAARFEEWHLVAGSGPILRQVLPRATLDDPAFIFVVGYDDEGAACQALAIRSEEVIGIYAVGTIDRARRRGFGAAITWAAIDAGRRTWGCETAVLQSSEMGLRVYEQMGFVEVCRYIDYERPANLPG